jgi:hypothetical protein
LFGVYLNTVIAGGPRNVFLTFASPATVFPNVAPVLMFEKKIVYITSSGV